MKNLLIIFYVQVHLVQLLRNVFELSNFKFSEIFTEIK